MQTGGLNHIPGLSGQETSPEGLACSPKESPGRVGSRLCGHPKGEVTSCALRHSLSLLFDVLGVCMSVAIQLPSCHLKYEPDYCRWGTLYRILMWTCRSTHGAKCPGQEGIRTTCLRWQPLCRVTCGFTNASVTSNPASHSAGVMGSADQLKCSSFVAKNNRGKNSERCALSCKFSVPPFPDSPEQQIGTFTFVTDMTTLASPAPARLGGRGGKHPFSGQLEGCMTMKNK